MPLKTIERYAALQYDDGTSRINLYFSDGTTDAYTALDPVRARLILSILRNEKPVLWNPDQRILATEREEQGEGERRFDLAAWLAARSAIRAAIKWETSSGPVAYDSWSSAQKQTLANVVAHLFSDHATGIEDPPPLVSTPAPGETARTLISEAAAWSIYIHHVAHSVVVEAGGYVPWSLAGLNSDQLWQIFDSRSLFHRRSSGNFEIEYNDGTVTPADPVKTFEFLAAGGMIGATRLDTIHRLLDWCRANLIHFSGDWEVSNVMKQWHYAGYPPVSTMIAGAPNDVAPGSPMRHTTGGCSGTTGFLRAVLRTANIPVKLVRSAGHCQPHFMSEGRYLSHGDDPYNAMTKAVPGIPISLLPITQSTWNSWFGAGVPAETVKNNVGRRACELGLEYLADYLLQKRCDDIASGASHAAGKVFETLNRYWTVAQLEAMDLWNRLDAKIAARGGCGHF